MRGTPLAIGRRVLVSGLAGAGKSTLSRALSEKTGVPLIHLDLHFWQPGWVEPSEQQWRDIQRGLLAGDAWIADGNYYETLDVQLERAETVVYLTTPWWICSWRALGRGLKKRGALPEGCPESAWKRLRAEWWLAYRIWRHRNVEPRRDLAIIAERGKHARLHVLGSKREVRAFLDAVGH